MFINFFIPNCRRRSLSPVYFKPSTLTLKRKCRLTYHDVDDYGIFIKFFDLLILL